ncbi:MAG TPA: hypothetical protein VGF75_01520 [Candidatus Saccharimonadales bacterium]
MNTRQKLKTKEEFQELVDQLRSLTEKLTAEQLDEVRGAVTAELLDREWASYDHK